MGDVERPDEDPDEPVERDGVLTAPPLLLERKDPDEPEEMADEEDPEEVVDLYTLLVEEEEEEEEEVVALLVLPDCTEEFTVVLTGDVLGRV